MEAKFWPADQGQVPQSSTGDLDKCSGLQSLLGL